jgi:hypothetical protein
VDHTIDAMRPWTFEVAASAMSGARRPPMRNQDGYEGNRNGDKRNPNGGKGNGMGLASPAPNETAAEGALPRPATGPARLPNRAGVSHRSAAIAVGRAW